MLLNVVKWHMQEPIIRSYLPCIQTNITSSSMNMVLSSRMHLTTSRWTMLVRKKLQSQLSKTSAIYSISWQRMRMENCYSSWEGTGTAIVLVLMANSIWLTLFFALQQEFNDKHLPEFVKPKRAAAFILISIWMIRILSKSFVIKSSSKTCIWTWWSTTMRLKRSGRVELVVVHATQRTTQTGRSEIESSAGTTGPQGKGTTKNVYQTRTSTSAST